MFWRAGSPPQVRSVVAPPVAFFRPPQVGFYRASGGGGGLLAVPPPSSSPCLASERFLAVPVHCFHVSRLAASDAFKNKVVGDQSTAQLASLLVFSTWLVAPPSFSELPLISVGP